MDKKEESAKIEKYVEKFTCQGLTPEFTCDGLKWQAKVKTYGFGVMVASGYTKLGAIRKLYMHAKNEYLISEESKDGDRYEEEFWQ